MTIRLTSGPTARRTTPPGVATAPTAGTSPAKGTRLLPAALAAWLARWPRTLATLRLLGVGTLTLGLGVLLGTATVTLDISRAYLAITSGSATLLVVLVTVLQPRLLFDQGEPPDPEDARRPRRARRSPAPTTTLRRGTAGKGSGRTPQAVETLAAAGAEPTDIAWQTGLPVDAISMVLTMARRRQVPPPVR